jgi:hypothetical protein
VRCDAAYRPDGWASQQVSELAEKRWSDASAPFYRQKSDFSGDIPQVNLMMRESLGAKSFQQKLIPNGLKIICKISRKIYTPWDRGWGGRPDT